MMKKLLLLLLPCVFVIAGCQPSYEDEKMQEIHNKIVEELTFDLTCDVLETAQDVDKYLGQSQATIDKMIILLTKEQYSKPARMLIVDLYDRRAEINKANRTLWKEEIKEIDGKYYDELEKKFIEDANKFREKLDEFDRCK